MIDSKRPHVYIDEEEENNKNCDGYDDYQGDDGSMGENTLDPTIDGSGKDYDYNKWNDVIVEEYRIGNVEEDVILTQQIVQHPGKFSFLLAECTYTSQRVLGGDNISHSGDRTHPVTPNSTCQHGLYQRTYTTECVEDTNCEGNTDTNINGIDQATGDDVIDRGIGASASGTLNDNRLVTVVEVYEVYNVFSSLHGGK